MGFYRRFWNEIIIAEQNKNALLTNYDISVLNITVEKKNSSNQNIEQTVISILFRQAGYTVYALWVKK